MKLPQYTKEELEIIDYIENKNPQSDPKATKIINELTQAIKWDYNNNKRRKQISFKILEDDLKGLKNKASIEWIPYQTLLNSIIHKYLNWTLINK